MAFWKPVNMKKDTVISSFGDMINTAVPPFDIKDSELTYVRNMSSHNYPAVGTRWGRTFFSTSLGTLASPHSLGERNNEQLHVVYGNTWACWNSSSTSLVSLTTTLASTEANILDYATGTNRYTILMNGTNKLIWDGTSTALTFGDANTPATKIFTSFKGRIFAARDNDIMYSAFQVPNDWTSANDAGSIDITNAKGEITGLCEYNGYLIAFTQYGMHELHGDDPGNFSMIDIEGSIGCVSHKSIVKCSNLLFWVGVNGIYVFNGATPQKISYEVNEYMDNVNKAYWPLIFSGSLGDYLYVAIPYNSTSINLVLMYDIKLKKWSVETGSYVDFVTIANKLYGLDSTGGVTDMRNEGVYTDNGTPIAWDMITKPFHKGGVSRSKTLRSMSVIYECSTDASINVSYSTDVSSTAFVMLAASSDFQRTGVEHNKRITIPTSSLQAVDWYRLRFNGEGKFILHYLEEDYRIKMR